MSDLEKVIKGLEHCLEGIVGCQKGCPYKRDFACRSELARAALALLKEQEERIKKFELEKGWDESPDMMGKW